MNNVGSTSVNIQFACSVKVSYFSFSNSEIYKSATTLETM